MIRQNDRLVKMIVAVDRRGGIGHRGELPWGRKYVSDLHRFKALTLGCAVMAGRKTFFSLPDLGGRTVYGVSRSLEENPRFRISPESAMVRAWCDGHRVVWIVGGAEIYRHALERLPVDEIHVTRIPDEHPADAHFPDLRYDASWTCAVDVGGPQATRWQIWRPSGSR